ncbi:MAG: cytochrome B [Rhodobacter sp.]|nr:cytochrome B [Rhodobacter sp.]
MARFARVVAGPGAMLACLGTMLRGGEGRCPGHNPAGAVMILALLLTHPGTAFRGWLMADPAPAARLPALPQVLVAPAGAGNVGHPCEKGRETEGRLQQVNETLAALILLPVAVPVGGVVPASVRRRENRVRAVITGQKRAPRPGNIA